MPAAPPNLDELERRLDSAADRLRHLSASRLAACSDAVREQVGSLAGLALRAEGEGAHTLPEVADRALGDQVAVLGRDLVDALARRPDPELLEQAHALVRSLRHVLP